jgi:hypothetical protein
VKFRTDFNDIYTEGNASEHQTIRVSEGKKHLFDEAIEGAINASSEVAVPIIQVEGKTYLEGVKLDG